MVKNPPDEGEPEGVFETHDQDLMFNTHKTQSHDEVFTTAETLSYLPMRGDVKVKAKDEEDNPYKDNPYKSKVAGEYRVEKEKDHQAAAKEKEKDRNNSMAMVMVMTGAFILVALIGAVVVVIIVFSGDDDKKSESTIAPTTPDLASSVTITTTVDPFASLSDDKKTVVVASTEADLAAKLKSLTGTGDGTVSADTELPAVTASVSMTLPAGTNVNEYKTGILGADDGSSSGDPAVNAAIEAGICESLGKWDASSNTCESEIALVGITASSRRSLLDEYDHIQYMDQQGNLQYVDGDSTIVHTHAGGHRAHTEKLNAAKNAHEQLNEGKIRKLAETMEAKMLAKMSFTEKVHYHITKGALPRAVSGSIEYVSDTVGFATNMASKKASYMNVRFNEVRRALRGVLPKSTHGYLVAENDYFPPAEETSFDKLQQRHKKQNRRLETVVDYGIECYYAEGVENLLADLDTSALTQTLKQRATSACAGKNTPVCNAAKNMQVKKIGGIGKVVKKLPKGRVVQRTAVPALDIHFDMYAKLQPNEQLTGRVLKQMIAAQYPSLQIEGPGVELSATASGANGELQLLPAPEKKNLRGLQAPEELMAAMTGTTAGTTARGNAAGGSASSGNAAADGSEIAGSATAGGTAGAMPDMGSMTNGATGSMADEQKATTTAVPAPPAGKEGAAAGAAAGGAAGEKDKFGNTCEHGLDMVKTCRTKEEKEAIDGGTFDHQKDFIEKVCPTLTGTAPPDLKKACLGDQEAYMRGVLRVKDADKACENLDGGQVKIAAKPAQGDNAAEPERSINAEERKQINFICFTIKNNIQYEVARSESFIMISKYFAESKNVITQFTESAGCEVVGSWNKNLGKCTDSVKQISIPMLEQSPDLVVKDEVMSKIKIRYMVGSATMAQYANDPNSLAALIAQAKTRAEESTGPNATLPPIDYFKGHYTRICDDTLACKKGDHKLMITNLQDVKVDMVVATINAIAHKKREEADKAKKSGVEAAIQAAKASGTPLTEEEMLAMGMSPADIALLKAQSIAAQKAQLEKIVEELKAFKEVYDEHKCATGGNTFTGDKTSSNAGNVKAPASSSVANADWSKTHTNTQKLFGTKKEMDIITISLTQNTWKCTLLHREIEMRRPLVENLEFEIALEEKAKEQEAAAKMAQGGASRNLEGGVTNPNLLSPPPMTTTLDVTSRPLRSLQTATVGSSMGMGSSMMGSGSMGSSMGSGMNMGMQGGMGMMVGMTASRSYFDGPLNVMYEKMDGTCPGDAGYYEKRDKKYSETDEKGAKLAGDKLKEQQKAHADFKERDMEYKSMKAQERLSLPPKGRRAPMSVTFERDAMSGGGKKKYADIGVYISMGHDHSEKKKDMDYMKNVKKSIEYAKDPKKRHLEAAQPTNFGEYVGLLESDEPEHHRFLQPWVQKRIQENKIAGRKFAVMKQRKLFQAHLEKELDKQFKKQNPVAHAKYWNEKKRRLAGKKISDKLVRDLQDADVPADAPKATDGAAKSDVPSDMPRNGAASGAGATPKEGDIMPKDGTTKSKEGDMSKMPTAGSDMSKMPAAGSDMSKMPAAAGDMSKSAAGGGNMSKMSDGTNSNMCKRDKKMMKAIIMEEMKGIEPNFHYSTFDFDFGHFSESGQTLEGYRFVKIQAVECEQASLDMMARSITAASNVVAQMKIVNMQVSVFEDGKANSDASPKSSHKLGCGILSETAASFQAQTHNGKRTIYYVGDDVYDNGATAVSEYDQVQMDPAGELIGRTDAITAKYNTAHEEAQTGLGIPKMPANSTMPADGSAAGTTPKAAGSTTPSPAGATAAAGVDVAGTAARRLPAAGVDLPAAALRRMQMAAIQGGEMGDGMSPMSSGMGSMGSRMGSGMNDMGKSMGTRDMVSSLSGGLNTGNRNMTGMGMGSDMQMMGGMSIRSFMGSGTNTPMVGERPFSFYGTDMGDDMMRKHDGSYMKVGDHMKDGMIKMQGDKKMMGLEDMQKMSMQGAYDDGIKKMMVGYEGIGYGGMKMSRHEMTYRPIGYEPKESDLKMVGIIPMVNGTVPDDRTGLDSLLSLSFSRPIAARFGALGKFHSVEATTDDGTAMGKGVPGMVDLLMQDVMNPGRWISKREVEADRASKRKMEDEIKKMQADAKYWDDKCKASGTQERDCPMWIHKAQACNSTMVGFEKAIKVLTDPKEIEEADAIAQLLGLENRKDFYNPMYCEIFVGRNTLLDVSKHDPDAFAGKLASTVGCQQNSNFIGNMAQLLYANRDPCYQGGDGSSSGGTGIRNAGGDNMKMDGMKDGMDSGGMDGLKDTMPKDENAAGSTPKDGAAVSMPKGDRPTTDMPKDGGAASGDAAKDGSARGNMMPKEGSAAGNGNMPKDGAAAGGTARGSNMAAKDGAAAAGGAAKDGAAAAGSAAKGGAAAAGSAAKGGGVAAGSAAKGGAPAGGMAAFRRNLASGFHKLSALKAMKDTKNGAYETVDKQGTEESMRDGLRAMGVLSARKSYAFKSKKVSEQFSMEKRSPSVQRLMSLMENANEDEDDMLHRQLYGERQLQTKLTRGGHKNKDILARDRDNFEMYCMTDEHCAYAKSRLQKHYDANKANAGDEKVKTMDDIKDMDGVKKNSTATIKWPHNDTDVKEGHLKNRLAYQKYINMVYDEMDLIKKEERSTFIAAVKDHSDYRATEADCSGGTKWECLKKKYKLDLLLRMAETEDLRYLSRLGNQEVGIGGQDTVAADFRTELVKRLNVQGLKNAKMNEKVLGALGLASTSGMWLSQMGQNPTRRLSDGRELQTMGGMGSSRGSAAMGSTGGMAASNVGSSNMAASNMGSLNMGSAAGGMKDASASGDASTSGARKDGMTGGMNAPGGMGAAGGMSAAGGMASKGGMAPEGGMSAPGSMNAPGMSNMMDGVSKMYTNPVVALQNFFMRNNTVSMDMGKDMNMSGDYKKDMMIYRQPFTSMNDTESPYFKALAEIQCIAKYNCTMHMYESDTEYKTKANFTISAPAEAPMMFYHDLSGGSTRMKGKMMMVDEYHDRLGKIENDGDFSKEFDKNHKAEEKMTHPKLGMKKEDVEKYFGGSSGYMQTEMGGMGEEGRYDGMTGYTMKSTGAMGHKEKIKQIKKTDMDGKNKKSVYDAMLSGRAEGSYNRLYEPLNMGGVRRMQQIDQQMDAYELNVLKKNAIDYILAGKPSSSNVPISHKLVEALVLSRNVAHLDEMKRSLEAQNSQMNARELERSQRLMDSKKEFTAKKNHFVAQRSALPTRSNKSDAMNFSGKLMKKAETHLEKIKVELRTLQKQDMEMDAQFQSAAQRALQIYEDPKKKGMDRIGKSTKMVSTGQNGPTLSFRDKMDAMLNADPMQALAVRNQLNTFANADINRHVLERNMYDQCGIARKIMGTEGVIEKHWDDFKTEAFTVPAGGAATTASTTGGIAKLYTDAGVAFTTAPYPTYKQAVAQHGKAKVLEALVFSNHTGLSDTDKFEKYMTWVDMLREEYMMFFMDVGYYREFEDRITAQFEIIFPAFSTWLTNYKATTLANRETELKAMIDAKNATMVAYENALMKNLNATTTSTTTTTIAFDKNLLAIKMLINDTLVKADMASKNILETNKLPDDDLDKIVTKCMAVYDTAKVLEEEDFHNGWEYVPEGYDRNCTVSYDKPEDAMTKDLIKQMRAEAASSGGSAEAAAYGSYEYLDMADLGPEKMGPQCAAGTEVMKSTVLHQLMDRVIDMESDKTMEKVVRDKKMNSWDTYTYFDPNTMKKYHRQDRTIAMEKDELKADAYQRFCTMEKEVMKKSDGQKVLGATAKLYYREKKDYNMQYTLPSGFQVNKDTTFIQLYQHLFGEKYATHFAKPDMKSMCTEIAKNDYMYYLHTKARYDKQAVLVQGASDLIDTAKITEWEGKAEIRYAEMKSEKEKMEKETADLAKMTYGEELIYHENKFKDQEAKRKKEKEKYEKKLASFDQKKAAQDYHKEFKKKEKEAKKKKEKEYRDGMASIQDFDLVKTAYESEELNDGSKRGARLTSATVVTDKTFSSWLDFAAQQSGVGVIEFTTADISKMVSGQGLDKFGQDSVMWNRIFYFSGLMNQVRDVLASNIVSENISLKIKEELQMITANITNLEAKSTELEAKVDMIAYAVEEKEFIQGRNMEGMYKGSTYGSTYGSTFSRMLYLQKEEARVLQTAEMLDTSKDAMEMMEAEKVVVDMDGFWHGSDKKTYEEMPEVRLNVTWKAIDYMVSEAGYMQGCHDVLHGFMSGRCTKPESGTGDWDCTKLTSWNGYMVDMSVAKDKAFIEKHVSRNCPILIEKNKIDQTLRQLKQAERKLEYRRTGGRMKEFSMFVTKVLDRLMDGKMMLRMQAEKNQLKHEMGAIIAGSFNLASGVKTFDQILATMSSRRQLLEERHTKKPQLLLPPPKLRGSIQKLEKALEIRN